MLLAAHAIAGPLDKERGRESEGRCASLAEPQDCDQGSTVGKDVFGVEGWSWGEQPMGATNDQCETTQVAKLTASFFGILRFKGAVDLGIGNLPQPQRQQWYQQQQ